MNLPEIYPTQDCYNLKAELLWVRVQTPIKLRSINHLEIESPERLRHVCLSRIWSLGRLRQVNLLETLDWQIPKQAEA